MYLYTFRKFEVDVVFLPGSWKFDPTTSEGILPPRNLPAKNAEYARGGYTCRSHPEIFYYPTCIKARSVERARR
jgi:hypothetical protein